jgi:hypothetical protein
MMNTKKSIRSAERATKGGALFGLLFMTVIGSGPVIAQQQAAPAQDELPRAAYAFARMMDPNAWMQMMTMSMDPRIWMNPISSCVACHDNEDVARYQQAFGPFTAMMNPVMMTNPQAYNDMMASAFDAEAADHWRRAVEEKYGLNPGDPLPGMHGGWPWGTAPTPPAQAAQ